MSTRAPGVVSVGVTGALLGGVAGIAEVVGGTQSWTGDKNDPATLGWVTVGLAIAVGAASLLAARSRTADQRLTAAVTMLGAGVLGTTTAGLAWMPAALASVVGAVLLWRHEPDRRAWSRSVSEHCLAVLVVVLCVIYLAFGIVDLDGAGVLGVVGAVVVAASLALRHRSRSLAAVLLVTGAVPFAVATAWSLVVPLTGLLMIAIGLPYLLGTKPAAVRLGSASSGPRCAGRSASCSSSTASST